MPEKKKETFRKSGGVELKEHRSPHRPKLPKLKANVSVPQSIDGNAIKQRNQMLCRWTVALWKAELWASALHRRVMRFLWSQPLLVTVADWLYMLGFWVEYGLLCTGRRAAALGRLLAGAVRNIYWQVFHPVMRVLWEFIDDMIQPTLQCAAALRQLRQQRRLLEKSGARVRRTPQNVTKAFSDYGIILWRGISCFLPFIALAGLVFTVHTVLNYQYVLGVKVNNRVVGYVASERVFDEAKLDVQERVAQAQSILAGRDGEEAEQGQQWEINPTFTLQVYDGRLMDESAMADAILRASSDQIKEATALYVDNRLRAVTTEGDRLRAYLEALKAPYEEPDNPDLRVEFTRDIELVDGVYFTDSISSYDEIISMIEGKEQEEKRYTVQSGDTPWMIAVNNDLTLNELYDMNPEMTQKGYNMYIGDQLVVAREVDFLTVKQVYRTVWQEAIPYSTVTTESDEYDWGVTRTISSGSEGLKEIVADITYIDGIKVSTDYIQETVLVEPVNAEVVKGTHLKSGMVAAYGSGSFIWPVPNYKYVSRWMSGSHTGADICAAGGSPILACDSGVVVTSGWHYSYGYHVVIDHGNGYRTLYAHMIQFPNVTVGQGVRQGQIIGYVGSTGNSSGNHLHLEMYHNGVRFSARSIFGGM